MLSSDLLWAGLLSGTIGLVSYCAGCAFHVWKSRNRERLRGLSLGTVILLIVGAGLLIFSFARDRFFRSPGKLEARNLFAVPPISGVGVDWVNPGERVEKGDLLIRYAPLEREAASGSTNPVLREAMPQVLPDSPLSRELQELNAWQRQLQQAIVELQIETARLARDRVKHRLERADELAKVRFDLDRNNRELAQAKAKQEFAAAQLDRSKALYAGGTVATEEVQKLQSELAVLENEVAKLATNQANLETRKLELERGLTEITATADHQTALLQTEIGRSESELKRLASGQRQVAALTERMKVVAPFAGRIALRSASPQMTQPRQPLLVLAPSDGFSVLVRLPKNQTRWLRERNAYHFRLPDSHQTGDRKLPFLERRFEGYYKRSIELPLDSRFVLAEFTCQPPAEAILPLVTGDPLPAWLSWSAPFWSSPLFASGLGCLCVATLLPVIGRKRRLTASPVDPQECFSSLPEMDEEARGLRDLGAELRRRIVTRSVSPALVQLAYRTVGQSPAAGRLISAGLKLDEGLLQDVESWASQHGSASHRGDTVLPLLKLMAQISSDTAASRLRQIEAGLVKPGGEEARVVAVS